MTATTAAPDERFAVARNAMVDSQLRTNDVIDPAIVAAMRKVPREHFLPDTLHAACYSDRALPMGEGRALNPPLTTARLIADARPTPGQRALLIGAASGYAAALLAELGLDLVAVESDALLTGIARSALADTAGVTLVEGEMAEGAPDAGPFDLLIVDGAVEQLPPALIAQLKPGARIASGVADGPVRRLGRAIAPGTAQAIGLLPFADLECVVLPEFSVPNRFTF